MPAKNQKKWNPITGCTKISPGCAHCYAERMARRFAGRYGYPKDNPFQPGTYHEDVINKPLEWKKSRMIFVCSMGDLFHDDVPNWMIDEVFKRITKDSTAHHIFQVITKRPERMKEYCERRFIRICLENSNTIWLGVTAENQEQADKRIPILLQIPAAVRFVSIEPMLGPIDIEKWLRPSWGELRDCEIGGKARPLQPAFDWVICGGESGPGARPMKLEWVRGLRDQCKASDVSFFFKQWGGVNKKKAGRELDGKTWDEFPITREEVFKK